MINIIDLLKITIDRNASDLHIIPNYYPSVRINNDLFSIQISEVVTKESSETTLLGILKDEQKENLLANKEIDFGYEAHGARFRVNMYYARGAIAAAFRLIPTKIRTLAELNLPPVIQEFTEYRQGLVLFVGPTGEGKSTSLASIINEINLKTAKHIITIEDPIEFTYPAAKSIVSQRELQQDTHSWTIALRSVLREDPDVCLIGEMRDYDTVQAALTIAETGHLVFSTLHTTTAAETINRIIDVFPSHQQNQIRAQLSSTLRAVVSQRLVPDITGKMRYPANEIMINIPSVAAVIREGKIFMLDNIIMTNEAEKMMLFEKALAKLHSEGKISRDTAFSYALRPNDLKKFVA
ncbi:PilT/PilU family type 4a pilus ATPase [Candidatus Roizmanbacteria bacterium]|nr:PilT/PilU family type 4a pilus ATPase [Candidatus Roizmanbacteria bacterium]